MIIAKRLLVFCMASLILFLSRSAMAAEDYDCYSPDHRVEFHGKTQERNGIYRFISGVNVWVNGQMVRHIRHTDLSSDYNPDQFEYEKDGLYIKLDWEHSQRLILKFSDHKYSGFNYDGSLVCS